MGKELSHSDCPRRGIDGAAEWNEPGSAPAAPYAAPGGRTRPEKLLLPSRPLLKLVDAVKDGRESTCAVATGERELSGALPSRTPSLACPADRAAELDEVGI